MDSMPRLVAAVVNSSVAERDELTRRLQHLQHRGSPALLIDPYPTHSALLDSPRWPDLVFLSLRSPDQHPSKRQLDGRLLPAQSLRAHFPDTPIILLSDRVEDAIDGYRIPVQGCLHPAADVTEFRQTVKACLGQILRHERDFILLATSSTARKVRVNEVQYVEADRNRMIIHTDTSPIAVKSSLVALEKTLTTRGFVRSTRSHLLNVSRIAKIHSNHVVLLDGRTIPLSRMKRSALVQTIRELTARRAALATQKLGTSLGGADQCRVR